MSKKLNPFIKWAGGKSSELNIIKEYMPEYTGRYIEPFVGGGAVFLSIGNDKKKIINDKSKELMDLYKAIQSDDKDFFNMVNMFNLSWLNIEKYVISEFDTLSSIYKDYKNDILNADGLYDKINDYVDNNKEKLLLLLNNFRENDSFFINEVSKTLNRKYKRVKEISLNNSNIDNKDLLDNIEAGFKSSYYMYIRYIYNNMNNIDLTKGEKSAVFYFIREYCYSSMFRYNKKGEFNVPYGGISYNTKEIKTKIDMIKENNYKDYLKDTDMYSLDFEDLFNKIEPDNNDFIFLDPPYDSSFNSYANMDFTHIDQERLAELLKKTDSKFMMVIKNTDFIYELYKDYTIIPFDKNYSVNFHNRNNRDTEHLLIKNY